MDKVSGKGLSTNDFTNAYKSKLDDDYMKSIAFSLSNGATRSFTAVDGFIVIIGNTTYGISDIVAFSNLSAFRVQSIARSSSPIAVTYSNGVVTIKNNLGYYGTFIVFYH